MSPDQSPEPELARHAKVLREEAVWQKLQKAGISNEGGTPQALTAFIRAETQRVRAVVNKAVSTGTAG